MSNQIIWDDKAVGETIPLTVDFADRLVGGETINGASVTAAVYTGTDPNPTGILSGAPSFTSPNVTQAITAGIAGNVYTIAFTVTTSASHNYVKTGFLGVVSNTNVFA